MTREENMGATKDRALIVHTSKNFNKEKKDNFHHNKKKDKKKNNTKRDPSNVRCYTCDEKGHFAGDYPIKKRIHHAHVSEDDEPINKRFIWEKNDSYEEYVLISTLNSTISHMKEMIGLWIMELLNI